MLSSICVATTTWFAQLPARHGPPRFCTSRYFLGWKLHPQVAARHHPPSWRARTISSRFSTACGFSILVMIQARPAVSAQRLSHVLGPLHERQADIFDAMLQGEGDIGPVLFGKRRDREHHVGHVDALAVGKGAADDDLGLERVLAAAALNPKPRSLPSSSSRSSRSEAVRL